MLALPQPSWALASSQPSTSGKGNGGGGKAGGRHKDLEKALAHERLGHLLDEAYLQIACRTAGIPDVEDFKKKHAGKV